MSIIVYFTQTLKNLLDEQKEKSCINISTQKANKSSMSQLNNDRKITENDVKGNKKDDFLSSKTALQYFNITGDDVRLLVSL